MAIKADYMDGSITIKKALIRIERIWGSKKENWNAWVNVYEKSTKNPPSKVFSISTVYIDGQNPYEALYAEIGKFSFLSNIEHDVMSELNAKIDEALDTLVDVVHTKPKKKSR